MYQCMRLCVSKSTRVFACGCVCERVCVCVCVCVFMVVDLVGVVGGACCWVGVLCVSCGLWCVWMVDLVCVAAGVFFSHPHTRLLSVHHGGGGSAQRGGVL